MKIVSVLNITLQLIICLHYFIWSFTMYGWIINSFLVTDYWSTNISCWTFPHFELGYLFFKELLGLYSEPVESDIRRYTWYIICVHISPIALWKAGRDRETHVKGRLRCVYWRSGIGDNSAVYELNSPHLRVKVRLLKCQRLIVSRSHRSALVS